MADAAASQELASAFQHHLEGTRGHVLRLESIFKQIGEKSSGETCEAMKGLIREGEILVKAEGDPDVRDAGLIGAAQRVEHYEMVVGRPAAWLGGWAKIRRTRSCNKHWMRKEKPTKS
jgi:ferritin-like metal-binding protein YciE